RRGATPKPSSHAHAKETARHRPPTMPSRAASGLRRTLPTVGDTTAARPRRPRRPPPKRIARRAEPLLASGITMTASGPNTARPHAHNRPTADLLVSEMIDVDAVLALMGR